MTAAKVFDYAIRGYQNVLPYCLRSLTCRNGRRWSVADAYLTKDSTDLLDLAVPENMARWMQNGIAEAGGFLSVPHGPEKPNVQLIAGRTGFIHNGLSRADRPVFTALAALLNPLSRGKLRLPSAEPFRHPTIGPAYLSEPTDLLVLSTALRALADITTQNPLARHLNEPFLPGQNPKILDDDAGHTYAQEPRHV
jgi:choline dehydrogenase